MRRVIRGRLVLRGVCMMAMMTAGSVWAQEARVEAPDDGEHGMPRAMKPLEGFVAVSTTARGGRDSGLRGTGCVENEVKHCNYDFDAQATGGLIILQGGFVAHEIAAATYTIPATEFPLYVNSCEFVVGSKSRSQTRMRYTILIWAGTPNNGTLVFSQQSEDPASPNFVAGVDLPDAVLPGAPANPPNAASILQIQFAIPNTEPAEDRILINDTGNHKFSVGIRIDDQIGQPDGSCAGPAPESSSVFPATDTNGSVCAETIAAPTGNYLFGLNCPGSLYPCPPGGGWATFAGLPCDLRCLGGDPTISLCCRPSGDWVIRAKWEPVACLPPVGACCLSGGVCQAITEDACSALSGSYAGDGTVCTSGSCVGACCRPDGSCEIVSRELCLSSPGAYRGNGTVCETAQCPQPQGACCFGTGCFNTTPANCTLAGGSYQGNGTGCINGQCPIGACCFQDGHCESPIGLNACLERSGAFQGPGTSCAQVSCPQPTGACCFTSGNCITVTQAQCAIVPGSRWLGAFTSCSGSLCPVGACCFANGSCSGGLTSTECSSQGGVFQGVGVACTASTCPQPTGACCLGNGACLALLQTECAIIPGSSWAGPLTTCANNNGNPQADVCEPPPSCPCDWNMMDGLDSQDFFDFLDGFFTGDADFNGVDGTDSQDYFDFINCFFIGCP